VLNVAARGSSTRAKVLDEALRKAMGRAGRKWGDDQLQAQVVFNVQTPLTEPLLCVPDYLNWAVQRVFERGETRFYDYLRDKIRLVVDLYDHTSYAGSGNYYDHKRNPLTAQNKFRPANHLSGNTPRRHGDDFQWQQAVTSFPDQANQRKHLMNPSFQEALISQVPALRVLQQLGFTYLSPEECAVERKGRMEPDGTSALGRRARYPAQASEQDQLQGARGAVLG